MKDFPLPNLAITAKLLQNRSSRDSSYSSWNPHPNGVDFTNLYLPYQPYPLRTPKGTNYLLPEIASNKQTNRKPRTRRQSDGAPATAWRFGKRLAAESATRLGTAASISPTAVARASEEFGGGRSLLASESLGPCSALAVVVLRGPGDVPLGAHGEMENICGPVIRLTSREFHLFGHSAVRASGPLVRFRFLFVPFSRSNLTMPSERKIIVRHVLDYHCTLGGCWRGLGFSSNFPSRLALITR
jgi:hypothetical protein